MENVLLHLGEVYTRGVECIVGRARTDRDGNFRFVGVPEEREAPTDGTLARERLFLAAFPPDELLSVDDTTTAVSPITGGFFSEGRRA